MTLTDEYIADWHAWHDDRIKDLTRPYGWLSIVCQDWLTEGVPYKNEFVPGTFLLREGEIYYHPDADDMASGNFVTIESAKVTDVTHIPHGYNVNSGTGSAVSLSYGDLEIETITRLNAAGHTIYAVRVRDPRVAAQKKFDDIATFPLSEEWIVPARFTPGDMEVIDVQTVEDGIFETSFAIGTLDLEIHGETFTVEVIGHRGGSQDTGYFADLTYVHLGDKTNGKQTYGGGRIVVLDPDTLADITALDLNRLISFPCALSTFVACAATPASNRLPFDITAGEHTPPVEHERIPTYTPSITAGQ